MTDDFVVLAICAGNLHRSALAEALLRRWSTWYLPSQLAPRVRTVSAGVIAPVGAPMGARVQQITAALGADGSAHSATRLTDAHLEDADLVLTASRRLRDAVLERVPAAVRRTFTIPEAGRIAASLDPVDPSTVDDLRAAVRLMADHRQPGDDDITDPEGRGDEAYAAMVVEEVPPLVRLATMLYGMPAGDAARYLDVVRTGEGLPFAHGMLSASGASSSGSARMNGRRS